jgi:phosphotransferase system HPr (HPr) family protein
MILERIAIRNEHGLHARPAAEFVKAAEKFHCSVQLARQDGEWVNGKSVLGILTLAVEPGQSVMLKIDGKGHPAEEQQALAALKKILEGNT